jgi:lysophospholipase L1-like esterase
VTAIVQAGANQPLSFTVGDDVSLRLTVTENSVAYSWTGATVTTSIIANGAAVANFTTATSVGGILDLSLTDTQTTTLGLGTFDYWVKVTKASVTSTWVAGQLTMHAPQYGSASNLSSSLSITTAASTTLAITLSGGASAYNVAARTLLQTPKVMASPPTLGAAATATAIVSPQSRQPSTSATNAELNTTFFSTPVGGAWAKNGTTNPNYNYVVKAAPGTGYGSTRSTIEFVVDCLAFEFMYKGNTGAYRIWVDGELVSATPTTIPNDAATYFKPLTFATRDVRHIVIDTTVNFKFGGVTIGPNDTVMPATVRRPKCLLIGDSIAEGTGASQQMLGFPSELANRLGWDVWSQAQGGSGYTAVGSQSGNFGSRITAHAAIPFDIVMFAGGYNDLAAQTTLQADAEAAFALAKTTWPKALVMATSPLINKGVEGWGTTYMGILDKIKTAATNQNIMWIDVMEMPFAGNTAVAGVFTSDRTVGGTTLLSSVSFPIGGTIEMSTGLSNVERRIVTAVSGASSPYTLTVAATTYAHNSGETITQVCNCLWTGTGRVGATTGTGNCDLYVSSDGVHPSDAGHAAIGSALAHAIAYQLKVASQ